jgi:hypothetical protein
MWSQAQGQGTGLRTAPSSNWLPTEACGDPTVVKASSQGQGLLTCPAQDPQWVTNEREEDTMPASSNSCPTVDSSWRWESHQGRPSLPSPTDPAIFSTSRQPSIPRGGSTLITVPRVDTGLDMGWRGLEMPNR